MMFQRSIVNFWVEIVYVRNGITIVIYFNENSDEDA